MIIIIQSFVIIIALIVLGAAFKKRSSHAVRASKKIGLIFLAIAMIIAVIFPDTTNVVANAVGVGRGADLLLYLTVTAFILYVLNDYLRTQNQREMIYKLARRIAILEAKNKPKQIKKS